MTTAKQSQMTTIPPPIPANVKSETQTPMMETHSLKPSGCMRFPLIMLDAPHFVLGGGKQVRQYGMRQAYSTPIMAGPRRGSYFLHEVLPWYSSLRAGLTIVGHEAQRFIMDCSVRQDHWRMTH